MQSAALYNDFGALADLRMEARQNSAESMEEVAAQFESLFVQMMVKSMRDATLKGELFDSSAMDNYQQMYDQQMSKDLAVNGGIGLAEVIVRQFGGPSAATSLEAGDFAPLPAPRTFAVGAAPQARAEDSGAAQTNTPTSAPRDSGAPATVRRSEADWDAETPETFLQSLRPHAQDAARALGLDPSVLLAQAALETGWGRKVVGDAQGPSNNFFNIKAGSDWRGPTVSKQALEYRDGLAVQERSEFRAYATAEASFADYVNFISESPRYAEALKAAGDGKAYLQELQNAGYATDPEYASKVRSIHARITASADLARL